VQRTRGGILVRQVGGDEEHLLLGLGKGLV
jgi:hypothetical protein